MWCRADSSNGYLCKFSIYTGKSGQGVEHGLVSASASKESGTLSSVTISSPLPSCLKIYTMTRFFPVVLCGQVIKAFQQNSMTELP